MAQEIKIINEYPPNWETIKVVFPVENARVVMTYGEAIYNPFNLPVREDLALHESVHMAQQRKCESPDAWWKRYIEDPKWRVEQELAAYGAQLKFLRNTRGPKLGATALSQLAKFISGPVYGGAISYTEAVGRLSKISRQ